MLSVDRKVISANDPGKHILKMCNSWIGDDVSQYVMPTEMWEDFIDQSKAITREAELKAADRFIIIMLHTYPYTSTIHLTAFISF